MTRQQAVEKLAVASVWSLVVAFVALMVSIAQGEWAYACVLVAPIILLVAIRPLLPYPNGILPHRLAVLLMVATAILETFVAVRTDALVPALIGTGIGNLLAVRVRYLSRRYRITSGEAARTLL